MFNDLTGLGYGIVVFAIIIGVGAIVISKFQHITKHYNYVKTNQQRQ